MKKQTQVYFLVLSIFMAGCGGSDETSTKPNLPPIDTNNPQTIESIEPIEPQAFYLNKSKTISLIATDPNCDGDELSFSATSVTYDVSFKFNGSQLTISSNNDYRGKNRIVVTVDDGRFSFDTSFILTVLLAPIAEMVKEITNIPTPPTLPSFQG